MRGVTPGRIVHYVAYGTPGGEYEAGAHRAAIITQSIANTSRISLCVFNPTGLHFVQHAAQDETDKAPGTWHWPEPA